MSRVMFGGQSNEYIHVRYHAGLVEADKANQVITSLPIPGGLVLSTERMAFRIMPALSCYCTGASDDCGSPGLGQFVVKTFR